MKKIISFVGMFAVMGAVFGDAHGVAMNANIRRLLQEKQDKIAKLEECEGKKQGWMIAGISTIGLTAVGVGVNIAQASKSNRLSDEIEMEKTTLQRQQDELDRIQNDIATKQAEKAEEERKRAEEEERRRNNAARANAGNSSVNVEVNPIPVLDNPDGKIGDTCGENSEGKWTEMTNGTKKCSNENRLVNCECIKNVQADVEPVTPVKLESSLEKCLRERSGDSIGTACCYLSKSVAVYQNGECKCTDTSKEFKVASNGHGQCVESRRESDRSNALDSDGYCYRELNGTEFNEYCDVDNGGEWGAVINKKMYKGIAKCSVIEGSFGNSNSIDGSDSGMYCYCKLSSGQKWVNVEQTTSCEDYCAYHCAYQFYSNGSFRDYFN